ncbi:MAG: putative ABC transport system permease protein [Bermanella sp.]|jgi:putative ABC transport system permease protein
MQHLRWLVREWRGGELALLLVSLVLAVTIVSGIAGFADRLQRGIVGESNKFLAADLVLQSPRPALQAWIDQAAQLNLRSARVVEFRSMIAVGESMQLASVKAVSESYPLKGLLRISDQPFALSYETASGPREGEAWLDARLFPLLKVSIGDYVRLGERQLVVSKALVSEPDRGSTFAGMGPRVLINTADIAASGVVRVGSLVDYRYLFAGEAAKLAQFQESLAGSLDASHKWQRLKDSQPQISQTLQRAERFLLLAGSFGVALAGVAVALAARRYSQRHLDSVAVMKAFGATSTYILRLYVGNIVLLAVGAAIVGWALGMLLQQVLFALIQDLVGFHAPGASWTPIIAGSVTAFICVFAFALPPVLRLRHVAPLRVLRRDIGNEGLSATVSAVCGLVGLSVLMLWYTQSVELVAAVLLGVLGILGLAGVLVLRVFSSIRKLASRFGGVTRLALSAMYRRRHANAFQVVSLALAMMVLLCLVAVRSSLLNDWQVQLPADTPNHFLVNIAPEQVPDVRAWFDEQGIEFAGLYPMVRGRLVTIDGRELAEIPGVDENRGSVNREINLSWSEQLPSDNSLVEGRWWDASEARALVSIEQEFAERLQVSVGSNLEFMIGGLPLSAQVSSIRSLRWDSMRPNFFLLFAPGVLDGYPSSSITSFYLAPQSKRVLNELLTLFPTITLIEMDAVISQARSVIAQVSAALELVLLLIVFAALLVGAANIQSSLDSRLHENAVLRTLGASRQVIARGLIAEFALIGAVSGLLASAGAEMSLYLLQTMVLDMSAAWHPAFWLLAPLVGAALVAVSGWWFCRTVVTTPPLYVLRQL